MQMLTRHRAVLLKLCSALFVFGAWEIAGRIPVSFAFPTFFESLAAFWVLIVDGTIFMAYLETLKPLGAYLARMRSFLHPTKMPCTAQMQ